LGYLELYFRISAALVEGNKNTTKQTRKQTSHKFTSSDTLFLSCLQQSRIQRKKRATSKSTSEAPPHFERNQKTNKSTTRQKQNKQTRKQISE
jgi:hypothetical protein